MNVLSHFILVVRHAGAGIGTARDHKTERGKDLVPTREDMISRLSRSSKGTPAEYDLIVVGGGATGAGVALDAQMRGMSVLCVEREDWSSGTSSRSTKLIWGGSRYLVSSMVALLNFDLRLLTRPVTTVKSFLSEFKMVLNCHRERKFLLDTQPHLTNWLPIAVPLSQWFIWPPPFKYPPAALGPVGLFPLFFKFVSDVILSCTCLSVCLLHNHLVIPVALLVCSLCPNSAVRFTEWILMPTVSYHDPVASPKEVSSARERRHQVLLRLLRRST
jgi:FAD dependent oxidoreductase